jgi:hypothetical protein
MTHPTGSLIAALIELLKLGGALLLIFVPLGAWKLVEILIWVWSHIHWGIS